jgi:hypothetical protein
VNVGRLLVFFAISILYSSKRQENPTLAEPGMAAQESTPARQIGLRVAAKREKIERKRRPR